MTEPKVEAAPAILGYEYVRPIGSGGYSNVYLYEQASPRRQVAIKVLKDAGLSESVRRQFTDEANAMAALEHPNIVPIITADVASDGRPYLVMQFYPRHNLGVRAASERFAVSEVLRIGIQISSAVETAHRAGFLHRDIKPANVLTDQYGTVGLTDFGIATQVTDVDDDDDETGVSMPWSPPETIYATAPASVQSDVYSLAATVWHLLIGRSPFEVPGGHNGQLELMSRIKSSPPPSTGRADVPASVDRLLQQALAKDPAARPPTALDFARSLQTIEQELRLQRTEIVVASDDDRDVPVAVDAAQHDDATRLRASRVDAQVQDRPAVAPVPAAPPGPAGTTEPSVPATTRSRPARVGRTPPASPTVPSISSTVRRAPVVAPTPSDTPDAPAGAPASLRVRPVWALLLLGGVIAAIVVVGLVAMSGGGDDEGGQTAATPPPTADDLGPPGDPVVAGTRLDASNVEFEWRYSNPADSDSYRYQTVDGTYQGEVDDPVVQLASPAGQPICLQVKVVRADGSDVPLEWSQEGCVVDGTTAEGAPGS